MGSVPNLPSELQEVEIELQIAFKRGGVKACRVVIDRLAAEAKFGKIVTDEAELAALEIEEDIETFPEIRESATSRIEELEKTSLAGKMA